MNRQTERYIKRMQNVVLAIKETPKPENFSMEIFGHHTNNECGSPACALGHYAYRRDLQKTFILNKKGTVTAGNDNCTIFVSGPFVTSHFGINSSEAKELFWPNGCNSAGTDREQVIAYIHDFIIQKWGVVT